MTCKLDACNQGRKDCPCPQICGDQPKPTGPSWKAIGWFATLLAAVVWAVILGARHA
jgi:hypothetical protein